MTYLNNTGKMEIFVERLVGGGFEIIVDEETTRFTSKAAAAAHVDEAIRVAQDLEMLWKIYDADKLN
jgi:hypothetical protein